MHDFGMNLTTACYLEASFECTGDWVTDLFKQQKHSLHLEKMQRRCLDISLAYERAVIFNAGIFILIADCKLLLNMHNFNENQTFFYTLPVL